MSDNQNWVLCPKPEVLDTVRWTEPLWAAPNKPRGKPDKIGEQQITAQVTAMGEFVELSVMSVEKLSGEAPLKVKEGDQIRRKRTSLQQGECHKAT